MKNIVICGDRQVGKSTLVSRLEELITVPVYGFRTKSMVIREDGGHDVYIFRASDKERKLSEGNLLASCGAGEMNINKEVFETLGVQYIREAEEGGVIIMDELGFMESDAFGFQKAVLDALDGEIPVIATVKSGDPDNEFLNKVRTHENADLYMIDENNRDGLYDALSALVVSSL